LEKQDLVNLPMSATAPLQHVQHTLVLALTASLWA